LIKFSLLIYIVVDLFAQEVRLLVLSSMVVKWSMYERFISEWNTESAY